MSHDMFYNVMQRNFDDMNEEYFDNNRQERVIQDMIRRLGIILHNTSKKGLNDFEMIVDVTLDIDKVSRGREILLREESRRFNGMVPAYEPSMELLKRMDQTSMGLLKRMEVIDEECRNDDCVICLENIGKEEVSCLPCSHLFHGDCIMDWLEIGHCCPICRHEIPSAR
ncbi:E3 ubiquitin-protein ligase like [Capsicum galapagoense]